MAQILCQRCKRETDRQGEVNVPSIADLDLRTLPYVERDEYDHLPICGGVYFAVADRGMCYIGQSGNLHIRWRHHTFLERFQLEKEGRILWLEINDIEKRRRYEKEAIQRFKPLWNRGGAERMGWVQLREEIAAEERRRFVISRTSLAFNSELHPNFCFSR